MRRKPAIIIAVAVTLLLGVVVALPWIVDVNRYRGTLEAAARQRLHRDVTLGPMRLSVLPLGLRVEHASVGEDPAFQTGRPFARLRALYVSPKLLPLLRGSFELRAVELQNPEIELVRGDSGWNVASLSNRQEPSAPSDSPSLVLNRLIISGGQVAITDLRSRANGTDAVDDRRAVYKNIDVSLTDFGPGREFEVELGATLPGAGAQRVAVDGKAGPLADPIAMTPFHGTATIDKVSIAGLQRYLSGGILEDTDGVLSGSSTLRNQQGRLSVTGALQLERPRVRGTDIGYPVAAEFDLTHDTNRQILTIAKGIVRLDKTPLSVTGTVDMSGEPLALDVRLTAMDAPLAEVARLASAFGVAFGANTKVQGRVSVDVRARGSAASPALDGTLRLRDVSISGADIPDPVRTAALDLALTPDAIRSNEFTIATAGTSVAVSVSLAQYTTPKPVLDARARTAGADLGDVLHAARAWGAGVDGLSGTGQLTLDVRAAGAIDSLNYSGSGSIADATLRVPSLAAPVRVRTAVLSFNRDTATLDKLAVGLGQTNLDGRFSIRSFAAPRVDFHLGADRIDVGEMRRLLSPASTPSRGAQPKTQPARPADSVFTRTTGTGSLRVGAVTYDRLLLEDVAATVTLDHGLVRLNPVTAAVYDGRHRGSIDVDTRRTPTAFAVSSTLEKVDANRLASSVTSLKDVIYGSLGSTMQMTVSGDGAQDMTRSMNGTLSLALTDGRIANLNLRREIASIARFVTGDVPPERTTRVAALSGHFVVKDGLARTEDLKATIEGGTLGATGTIDLASQQVNLRVTTVLSSDVSQKAGGSRVGGYMTTVLANQQGELVVPLLVTGMMSDPRVAPDLQRVAEMKLKSLVPSLRDPQGLSSGILGAIGGATQPGSSKRTINDIVGAVTGRTQPASEPTRDSGTPQTPTQPEAKKPAEKDTVKEVQDALRDLLRRRKQQEKPPEPAPTQPQK